jgi:hypothetical protein
LDKNVSFGSVPTTPVTNMRQISFRDGTDDLSIGDPGSISLESLMKMDDAA